TASIETRITRIIEEYAGPDAAVAPETLAQLEAALRALTTVFGKARMEELVALLRARDLRPLVRVLLEEHYDPRYAHAMRNYQYMATIPADDLGEAVQTLRTLVPVPGQGARQAGHTAGLA